MAISLYDLTVASYLQTLGAVSGFLDRGGAHCQDNNIDPESIVETRLWDDMLPFRFQIISVAHHSRGAIEGAKKGVFGPPSESRPLTYAQLQELVGETIAALKALTPADVNALEGSEVTFQMRDFENPVHGRELPDVVLDAELLFPRGDGLRHPALQGRAAWQARLHGRHADEAGGLRPRRPARLQITSQAGATMLTCAHGLSRLR